MAATADVVARGGVPVQEIEEKWGLVIKRVFQREAALILGPQAGILPASTASSERAAKFAAKLLAEKPSHSMSVFEAWTAFGELYKTMSFSAVAVYVFWTVEKTLTYVQFLG